MISKSSIIIGALAIAAVIIGALPAAQGIAASTKEQPIVQVNRSAKGDSIGKKDCVRERIGRFLPSAFAGENPVAYLHDELVGIIRISGSDVGLDMSKMLGCFHDLPRQVPNLPTDVTLLVGVNGTQLIEFTNLRIDLDLLNDGRVPGRNRLDLGVGERAALKVLRRAN